MIFKNAKINGQLCDFEVVDGKFTKIGKIDGEGTDLGGNTVIPGLVDVHTHGCVGGDTMDAEFAKMCDYLAKNGITSWLPTTMTVAMEDIAKTMNSDTNCKGAQILGFHMEGPYINVKYKGAQNEKFIKAPDIEEFKKLPNVKMVTIAPEVEGSMEFIKEAKDLCVVSLGHTDTTYDIAMEAIKNGANCLTHSFNAMPPLHHRNPGLLGAGMETGIYAQIICDGLHIHKAVILAMYKIFGIDRLVLISDSMRATGMSDGEYEFGGQPILVKDGVARTMEGAIAGSTTNLWACVNKAVEFGIPFEDAVKMATETPAKMIGVNKGQLKEGFDADFVVLDDARKILGTYIAGVKYEG